MSVVSQIIRPVYAAPIDLGDIEGVGLFQKKVSAAGPSAELGQFISTIVTTITVFGSIAFVLYFTLAALKWITAGGDKNKVSEAKDQMTQGAIGLIAIVASYFIIGIIGAVLGLDILNPFKTLFGTAGPFMPVTNSNQNINY